MGMLVINLASIWAVIAAILMSLLLRRIFEIDVNHNKPLFRFAILISLLLPCIWVSSWWILRNQLVEIERTLFGYLDHDETTPNENQTTGSG